MKNMSKTTYKSYYTAIIIAIFAIGLVSILPGIANADYNHDYNYYYPVVHTRYADQVSYMYDRVYTDAIYHPVEQSVYYQQPTVYYPTYPQYPTYQYPTISASCYPNTSSTNIGNTITWRASVSGGTGSYSYVWSGTEGLSGSGSSVSKAYYSTGTKYASVIIYSGNQTVNISCNNTVSIYQNTYSTSYPVYYQQPVVIQTPTYVQPVYAQNNSSLDIGCYADPSSIATNQPITWSVEVTGGLAPYRYSWTGSDGLTGSQSSVTKYYSSSGDKSAIISVTSADGKSGTRACSNSVAVRPATTYVAKTVVTQPTVSTTVEKTEQTNTQYSAASLFSLANVPWGWVAILIILVLFAAVMYLLFNRNKI